MSDEVGPTPERPPSAAPGSVTGPAREGLSDAERAAALTAGRAPIPTKFIAWTVAALLALGLGGTLVEHFFGNVGLPSRQGSHGPTTTAAPGGPMESALDAFMGLRQIGSAQATPFTLTDQTGAAWSLRGARGRVVVLGFYGATCHDICPVLGDEVKQARALLGTNATRVEFVIVNTDPHALASDATPAALAVPGLAGLAGVHFLNGTLNQLNAVWSAYGVQVRVGAKASQVVHNDVMFFITPRGHLVAQVTPFANETHSGRYLLDAGERHRFARGIAQTAASLVG